MSDYLLNPASGVAGDLTTLQAAIDYIPDYASSPASDALLQSIITAASESIREYPGMPTVTVPVVEETRVEPVFDECTVRPVELLSVTAVTDQDGNELEHTVMPGKRPGDHVRWISLASRRDGQVRIAGTWGWTSVPPQLEFACRVTVLMWYQRHQQTFVSGVDIQTGFFEKPEALPKQVLGLLQAFISAHGR